jgi:hypothetical protein
MKKLIAISVVFALLATFAFAEASIGGGVGFGMKIIHDDSTKRYEDDDALFTSMGDHWVGINFNWQNDEGTAGGKIKVNGDTNKANPGDGVKLGGRIWWRPLELLKLEFTDLEDEGVMGRGNCIDWGYQATSAAGPITALWGGGWNSFSNAILRTGHGFYGGIGGGGDQVLALNLMPPVEGLKVNLAWAVNQANTTEDFFRQTYAQILFGLNGIGEFGVHYGHKAVNWYMPAHIIAFDFSLWALDGKGLEISASIPIFEQEFLNDNPGTQANPPVEIGLGFHMNQWSGEAFHLYARAGILLPVEDNWGGTQDLTAFAIDINPSYNLGMFRVFFDFGFGIASQDVRDGDGDVTGQDVDFFWHFSPYIRKSLGIGDLYVGFALWNGTDRGGYETMPWAIQGSSANSKFSEDPIGIDIVNFAIPIFFEISF